MIDMAMLKKLEAWRRKQAEAEGVELFRILPNQTLHQIVITGAKTREALIEIKGIKEKKFAKYGTELIAILNGEYQEIETETVEIKVRSVRREIFINEDQGENKKINEPLSVSEYLDAMNRHLFDMKGRVRGEVTQFQVRNSAIYFTIKDKEDNAVLSCFMWANAYQLSGVELEEGLEVVVHGMPQIYKPTGRMSMNATALELIGEGALKKAYEKLKAKLDSQGIFSAERKKPLPLFPKNIALITSREGAVIHDFMNNLGKCGFNVHFINSRVEGVYALRDLKGALNYFNKNAKKLSIDVLVIIRGGGSLESFQAFNNESIVREISSMNIPVIAGLGHHEDVPLAALAADVMVSTPTAATALLNHSWQEARYGLGIQEKNLFGFFAETVLQAKYTSDRASRKISSIFEGYMDNFRSAEHTIVQAFSLLKSALSERIFTLRSQTTTLLRSFSTVLQTYTERISYLEKSLDLSDPSRQLKLGFSLTKLKGKVLRSVKDLEKGETIETVLADGSVNSEVIDMI